MIPIRPLSERASRLFSVLAYDEVDPLFLTEDPALGFGFCLKPLTGLSPGASDRLSVLLNQNWPTGTLMSFGLWTSPDLEQVLAERWIRRKRPHALTRSTQDWLKGHPGGGPDLKIPIHRTEILCTVKLPLEAPRPTEDERKAATEWQRSTLETLRSIGLQPVVMDQHRWLRCMNVLLNGDSSATWRDAISTRGNNDQLLRDQILDPETLIETDHDGLLLGNLRVSALSVKRLPEHFEWGGALSYLGDVATGLRGLSDQTLINVSLHYPDRTRVRDQMDRKRQWTTAQAHGPLLKWLPELHQRQEDLQVFHAALIEGDRPIECYFGLFLLTSTERATEARGNAKVYFRELGFQLMDDRYASLPLFLQSLPLGAERKIVRESFRYRTLTSRSVLPLLPLFSEWAGTPTPSLNLFGRRGEWMQFSLFDSNSNYNAVIAAQSGSGKSFFTNELILNALEEGAQVWIIDVGRSYQNLAESLNGDFIAFGSADSPGLNPFVSLRDWNEEADLITGLMTAMAAPREPLSDFQSAVLKQTLQNLHESKGSSLTIDQVAASLIESPDLRIRDLGSQLYPFTSRGEYGHYFNRQDALSFRSDLTVLELEELKGRRHLQQVVLLELILAIQQSMYQGDRARPKLVIIDEAWELLTMGETAQFIEHGYRRFRKYGGAALTITQSINDLYRSPTGRAIAENSAHLILMGQKPEAIDQLKAEDRLPLDAGGYALLKTLRTEPGRYSECFILSDLGSGIGRLQVDPYRQLLYSTRPLDVAALRKLRREGLSLDEAIRTRLHSSRLRS